MPRLLSLLVLVALATACGTTPPDDPGAETENEPVATATQALSSVDCGTFTDTGYVSGSPFTITLVTVDGKPVEVDTANAYYQMAVAADAAGVTLVVNSGFRTMAEQQYLYGCYINCNCNNCNLAAQPGYSNHQSGHALDLGWSGGGYEWLEANAGAFGFTRTVPSESWHWEWWGGGPGGGPCGACSPESQAACGNYGCNCVAGQCNGGFCAGTGCSQQETDNCGAYGCGCVDHQCNGVFCPGTGCTAKETNDCGAYGCGCVDHQCNGGACAGTGCTAGETNGCGAYGCGCANHECKGGACDPPPEGGTGGAGGAGSGPGTGGSSGSSEGGGAWSERDPDPTPSGDADAITRPTSETSEGGCSMPGSKSRPAHTAALLLALAAITALRRRREIVEDPRAASSRRSLRRERASELAEGDRHPRR